MKPHRLLAFALPAIGLAQAGLYVPRMPNPMATHFDAAGNPNGWSSPLSFAVVSLLVLLATASVPLAIARLVAVLPASLVNLPDKDYWLAPERRADTAERLAASLGRITAASALLLLFLDQLIYRANLHPEPHLGTWPMLAVVVFIVYVAVASLRMASAFRRPD
jgi:uncharacterized membrane protein